MFTPFQLLAEYLVYGILAIPQDSRLGGALTFFVFDTLKILVLLGVILFAVSILRSFIPPQRVRNLVAARSPLGGHFLAALFGIITPFCSCSAVPLFLGFVQAGVPLGVTFSFLVSSPMVNEVALVMLLGLFGWKIALLYILSGVLIAVAAGLAIGKMHPELLVEPIVRAQGAHLDYQGENISWNERRSEAWRYTIEVIRGVWPYVVAGIAVGAFIHGYVPEDFLASYAGAGTWYAVPLAVIVGIPLYSNAAGIVPLVSVLTEKGVAMGTVLAFMMAVTALSIPEFMILRRLMKPRLILIFAATVGVGIMVTGYVFNALIG